MNELKPITGSIDEILNYCSTIDADAVETQIESELHRAALDEIKKMFDLESDYDAQLVLDQANESMLKQELDKLVEEGKIKIVGTDEEGNPLYSS